MMSVSFLLLDQDMGSSNTKQNGWDHVTFYFHHNNALPVLLLLYEKVVDHENAV